jgi:hypothetical protein
MPEIIITAAGATTPEDGEGVVTLRERINETDFDSERFGTNLLERIEWAVADATELERRGPITGRLMPPRPAREQIDEPELEPDPERDPVGVA